MRTAAAIVLGPGRALLLKRALIIGALAVAGCGISSIAPYNPDGAARAGSGGSVGSGGSPAASGGVGRVGSGGQGGVPGNGGSVGQASGGAVGVATGGAGGHLDAATGGRGGQPGSAVGGGSGTATGGSQTGGAAPGTGGAPATGGMMGGGGGASVICQFGDQRCSGNSIQTCRGFQWDSTGTCGTRQSCVQSGALAQCACKADPVCTAPGSSCSGSSMVISCAQDADSCVYQSVSAMCTAGTCSTAGGSASCCACNANVPQCSVGATSQACAATLVCDRTAPTVCADLDWAQWPMPNTPSDASNGAPNPAGYTDNGDGTVTDKVTGLMWQQASSGPFTWVQAMAHCPTVTLGGHKDWRVPTRIELLSIVDYGLPGNGPTPTINVTYFPMTLDAYYWTSTSRGGNPPTEAWIVNFAQAGGGYNQVTLSSGYTMCVR